ncbi:MAG: hypothetical protein ACO20C_01595 [Pontimonas sp.]
MRDANVDYKGVVITEFYGFLHLQPREYSAVNVSVGSFRQKIRTYLKNADLLSRSLAAHGHQFHLLTNKAELIERFSPEIARSLSISEIEFTTNVPSGVRFFSSHYKLDALKYLGNSTAHYVALIDLDMVCFNEAPLALRQAEESGQALYYDITEQVVPSAGEEPLRRQLEEILGRPVTLAWSGGEFLAGPPKFFEALTEAVESIFERYLDVSVGRYRVGNEPYQNAAIEILREKGWDIRDAGEMRIVGRYWNMPVKHRQPPFSAFYDVFLLHLPVDKHVLSLIHALNPSQASSFLSLYRSLKWLWLPLEVFQRLRGKVGAISIRR